MTERLELTDAECLAVSATVVRSEAGRVVLDRSVFYPGGGGQPPDTGRLSWSGGEVEVVGAEHDGDDVVLVLGEEASAPPAGSAVTGSVDEGRRRLLMRTHTALHVLSAVVLADFGAKVTGSAMEPGQGRMDFDLAEVPDGFAGRLEAACNDAVAANYPVVVRFVPAADAHAMPELIRHTESRVPKDVDPVRVVDIVGFDAQADGGLHVARTGEIGRIVIRKVESKGKGFRRVRLAVEDAEA